MPLLGSLKFVRELCSLAHACIIGERIVISPVVPQDCLYLPKTPFSGFHQCNIVTLRSKLGTILIRQGHENNRRL